MRQFEDQEQNVIFPKSPGMVRDEMHNKGDCTILPQEKKSTLLVQWKHRMGIGMAEYRV